MCLIDWAGPQLHNVKVLQELSPQLLSVLAVILFSEGPHSSDIHLVRQLRPCNFQKGFDAIANHHSTAMSRACMVYRD